MSRQYSVARVSRACALVALAALFAGCGRDATGNDDGFPVTDFGPFEVGYRRLETTYDANDGHGPRTIRVSVWYPAPADAADHSPEGRAQTFLARDMNAFLNAPLAPAAYRRGYPLVVHSHGDWGYSDQNFHVAEGYARHGYVVVAPMHEGNTALEVGAMIDLLATNYRRPMDVVAALDLIESGLPASDPLYHKVVTDRVIVSGHSRGTVSVMAVLGAQFDRALRETECTNGNYASGGGCTPAELARFDVNYGDDRFIAAVLAGGDGGPSTFVGGQTTFDAMTTPMLFMTGTDDGAYPGVTALFPTLTNDSHLVVFQGGCHDLPAGGGCPMITDTEAWPIIDDYNRAFVRRQLFDDETPDVTGILDGTIVLSPKVTYTP